MALHGNHLQIRLKGSLAHTIKDGINTVTVGNLLDLGDEVVVRIDGPLGAVLAGQSTLLLGAGRADDLGAYRAQHLHQKEADTAGSGVNEGPLAGLNDGGLADESECC